MSIEGRPKLVTDADRAIGDRIARLRSKQGLSQTALGQALGITYQQVQKYERGRNRVGAGRLQTIADVLRVPMEALFADPAAQMEGDRSSSAFGDDAELTELTAIFRTLSDPEIRAGILSFARDAAAIARTHEDERRRMIDAGQ